MATAEQLAAEWQQFQAEGQQLKREAERLQRALSSLPEDPEMRLLLDDKTKIKERLPELYTAVATQRRIVATRHSPTEVWKLQEFQQVLADAREYIASVEGYYRERHRCLKTTIRETEEKERQHHDHKIAWAAQSRCHLQWILDHASCYKDEAIRQYRARFPTDNLSDVLPPAPQPSLRGRAANGKKRRLHLEPVRIGTLAPTQPWRWRFWVTFNAHDPGQELSPKRDEFVLSLQDFLDAKGYRDLDATRVYEKLLAITKWSVHDRQQIREVANFAEQRGWKIVRVGDYRLFLSINEEVHAVHFIPCPRRESYGKH